MTHDDKDLHNRPLPKEEPIDAEVDRKKASTLTVALAFSTFVGIVLGFTVLDNVTVGIASGLVTGFLLNLVLSQSAM